MQSRALADAIVKAPFSGLVADRLVSRGEYVTPGQKLFELVSLDPIEVEFHLSEVDSSRVKVGNEVGVRVAPFPDETFSASVTIVSPTIDSRTRTLRVKAQLENKEGRLRPGLFARVDLGIAKREGVAMIAEEAVLQRADGAVVFRAVADNRVERRVIEVGAHHDGMVEVVSGLAPGDLRRAARAGRARRRTGGGAAQRRWHQPRRAHARRGRGARRRLMGSYDIFIRRPILTLMLTLALIVFGVLGYQRLGVDQFPDMDFPIVTVSAQMEGASPEVIEQDVTDVLEEHLNTIAGVRQLRSKSYHGTSVITVEFELGRDIDIAAQDVRDKVARARYQLPEDVEPPVVDKEDFGDEPVLWVPVNSDRPLVEASEYVRNVMKPRVETIEGVASVVLFGERERAIRIWLDGEELRARGLAATDILDAVRREHVELPGGEVESDRVEYSVKTDAEFRTVEELQRLIVAYVDGAPGPPARTSRGSRTAPRTRAPSRISTAFPTVGIGIRKQSGANTVSVVDQTYKRLDEMRPLLPPGYSFKGNDAAADFSKAIRESVDETLFALVFGALLAVLTVFVFLRRTRPTLIVAAAIPISLIATFGVMWLFDYTLNTMTLLALALAVGVVIDDAIVVLENIERHREQGEEPFEAASKGTREIAFAATASTVSIAVVFMPVIFVEGLVGSFLSEFGVTVAASVMVSLVVALTLTPMLAARMPAPKEREHGSIYHRLEQGFTWIETHYRRLIDWAFLHRKSTLGIAVGSFALALVLGRSLGAEFFPPSDNGMFFVRFTTPPGTTLETTREFLRRNEEWMAQQPELAGMFAGVGIGDRRQGGSSNEGMIFAILKSKKDRERTTQELVPLAREALAQIPGQQARVFDLSNMIGNVSGGTSLSRSAATSSSPSSTSSRTASSPSSSSGAGITTSTSRSSSGCPRCG